MRRDTGIWSDPKVIDLDGEAHGYKQLFRALDETKYGEPKELSPAPETLWGTPQPEPAAEPERPLTPNQAFDAAERKASRKK